MFGIGFQEILIILVVVLIIFGPKKLPELARLIGKGLAEFRRATYDLKSAIDLENINRYEPPAAPKTPPAELPEKTGPGFADDEIENPDPSDSKSTEPSTGRSSESDSGEPAATDQSSRISGNSDK
ncbi:twin-arginine translocase TatA/TatE family subunit [bacterium]|nr:twin-arginine translocase TatA/TatE family subunit [candidate division CSSED10-310 bacterium]